MSYRISERPWRSSSQPTLFIAFWQVLRNNSWTSNKHNEKKNKKRMNVEHGEENVQAKPHALCTQMSGSNLSEGFWCG